MRINELTIDRFGCLDGVQFEDLSSTTVVASPQRGGKSMLLDAITTLAGASTTDLNGQTISALVETDADTYRLGVDRSDRLVTSPQGDGPDRSVHQLLGDLDPEQYCDLYTIARPDLSFDANSSLANVLFEGAFATASELPAIATSFGETAAQIGGTDGRPVDRLAEPVATIQAGVDARRTAVARIDRYTEHQTKREDTTERTATIEETIERLTTRVSVLELVQSCYADATRLTEIQHRTAGVDEHECRSFPTHMVPLVDDRYEQYTLARERLESAQTAFRTAVASVGGEPTVETLTDRAADLLAASQRESQLREQYAAVESEATALDDELTAIRAEAAAIRDDWYTDLDALRTTTADASARDTITEIVTEYTTTADELRAVTHELAVAERRLRNLEAERADVNLPATYDQSRTALGLTVGGILGALLIGSAGGVVVDPVVGVVLATATLVLAGSGAVRLNTSITSTVSSIEELESSINDTRATVASLREKRADLQERHETATEEFESLQAEFPALSSVGPTGILDTFDAIVECKKRLRIHDERRQQLEDDRDELQSELAAIAADLDSTDVRSEPVQEPLAAAESILDTLQQTATLVERASMVDDRRTDLAERATALCDCLEGHEQFPSPEQTDPERLAECVEQVNERASRYTTLLPRFDEADRCRDRIETRIETAGCRSTLHDQTPGPTERDTETTDSDDDITAIQRIVASFEDTDALSTRLSETRSRIDALESTRSDLNEQREQLDETLQELRSHEPVETAATQIIDGQRDLRVRAERYAESRLAELFLTRLHETYVQSIAGDLLEYSSELFARMTGGAYAGVTLDESRNPPRFVALDPQENPVDPETLSGETTAQLFLAVRIARIARTDTAFPVVFDGLFGAFDPAHRKRVVDVCAEVLVDTQVLVLTSQPHCLELWDGSAPAVEFWTLDQSAVDGPTDCEAAVDFLDVSE